MPQDPIALGAWLYRGKCFGCHRDYASGRLAEDYDDKKDLIAAIGSERCRIAWSRRKGGDLNDRELAAIAEYFLKWEELGEEPELPELPPNELPLAAAPKEQPAAASAATSNLSAEEPGALSSALRKVIETFPVAAGGYLFTKNCYRCHLTYETARMGKGLPRENIYRIISEGKTSTQMKPFSRMLGGELKNSEIKNIVAYITAWEKFGEAPAIAAELLVPPAQDPADFVPLRLTRFKPVSGDSTAGKKHYIVNCLPCHGPYGEGYIGASLLGSKWTMRKDLFVKSVVKEGIPGSLMKSWSNGKGGPLSAKDVDDVVAFVVADTEVSIKDTTRDSHSQPVN